ncbi:MAG TPA: hypothetical protein DD407_00750 [Pseudohongiella sp.]|nr:hypothetical protein [Pseudohongiella sp.]
MCLSRPLDVLFPQGWQAMSVPVVSGLIFQSLRVRQGFAAGRIQADYCHFDGKLTRQPSWTVGMQVLQEHKPVTRLWF